MPNLDLNTLSIAELKTLQKSIAKTINGYEERKKAEARSVLEAQARKLGFLLSDLLGPAFVKKIRKAAKFEYQNPENPEVTWSGRGRKPRWYSDAVAAGKPPEPKAI